MCEVHRKHYKYLEDLQKRFSANQNYQLEALEYASFPFSINVDLVSKKF